MGLRKHEGEGCILADEMSVPSRRAGTGAELLLQGSGEDVADDHALLDPPQCASRPATRSELILCVEQNPYAGAGPVVGKILIVCPVSLVNVHPPVIYT